MRRSRFRKLTRFGRRRRRISRRRRLIRGGYAF